MYLQILQIVFGQFIDLEMEKDLLNGYLMFLPPRLVLILELLLLYLI